MHVFALRICGVLGHHLAEGGRSRWLGRWLAVIVAATSGCAEAELYDLQAVPTPPAAAPLDHTAVLSGTYCASDPESIHFPVKILFILDDSGSMKSSDGDGRRFDAALALVREHADRPSVSFAVEHFQDGQPAMLTDDPAFTQDLTTLEEVLNKDDPRHHPNGFTPYIGALSTAHTALISDIMAQDDEAPGTRYVVLFLTDGAPTDGQGLPGGVEESQEVVFEKIKEAVRAIKTLEITHEGVTSVSLHTAYLRGSSSEASVSETAAIDLLMDMAFIGGGEFRNFEQGQALDYTFIVDSLTQDFRTYAPILVSNISARLTAAGPEADSDGDGWPDSVELEEGTDPSDPDTDGDGCSDMLEKVYFKWDPLTPGWNTNPPHCACEPEDQGVDSDGDLLGDCDEFVLQTNYMSPDSDMHQEAPEPDHMLDYLEVIWNLRRLDRDDDDDYDGDGSDNLEELLVHTDPNQNEDHSGAGFRDSFAYQYEFVNQQAANPRCYDFRVSNIGLVNTQAAQGRAQGENRILLYFVEGPQVNDTANPYEEIRIRAVELSVEYQSDRTTPLPVAVTQEDFLSMGGLSASDG